MFVKTPTAGAVCLGIAVSTLTPTAEAGVGDGLVGFWSFNQETQPLTTVMDKSGKGNNGIPTDVTIEFTGVNTTNPPTSGSWGDWWQTKSSDVAVFNGSTSAIQVNEVATVVNSTALRLNATPFTIASWVKLAPTFTPSVSGAPLVLDDVYPIVSKPGWELSVATVSSGYYTYWDYLPVDSNSDGYPDWYSWQPVQIPAPMGTAKFCSGSTCVQSLPLSELIPNYYYEPCYYYPYGSGGYRYYYCYDPGYRYWGEKWANIAVTYDNTKKVATLYVNGVQQAVSGPTPAFPAPPATAGNLLIGKSQDGTNFFGPGRMEDVRIYNRVLTADEIRELAKGCKPATYNPVTGKISIPCVAETFTNPAAYYQVEMQQGVSAGSDTYVPAIDDISFAVSTTVLPKAIVPTPTNPEPAWGWAVAAYTGGNYYTDPKVLDGESVFLSGWLNLPLVNVVDSIGTTVATTPKTHCYSVYLDQVFTTNRFVLVDWQGVRYLGANCDAPSAWWSYEHYGQQGIAGEGQQGIASGDGQVPQTQEGYKPHREIPQPPPNL